MDTNRFQLGNSDTSRFVNILKVFFGGACIAVGIYLAVCGAGDLGNTGSAWITVMFMLGFGFYEIWSGLGKAERYIEIGCTFVRLKKNIFLPAAHIEVSEIDRICIFPLKVSFYLKKGTKVVLRFGTTYIETNEKIIDAIARLAEHYSICLECRDEEIC
ncbi:MAG: hypothetical protein LBV26_07550 [Bacteroidales bacterium]|jgi:hypothetical protein|nr:hypothetical protein [Bacteroidales bacterium]